MASALLPLLLVGAAFFVGSCDGLLRVEQAALQGQAASLAMPGGCQRENVNPCFKSLLQCGVAFLKKHDIPFRLTDGTLLGQHREGQYKGKFLPWDDDIDVSVDTKSWLGTSKQCFQDSVIELFNKDKAAHALPDACNHGTYEMKKCEVPQSPNLRFFTSACTVCEGGKNAQERKQHMDIVDDAKVRLVESKGRQAIAHETMWPAAKCTLEGVECFCPKDSDKYLLEYYGPLWKEPIYTGWDANTKQWVPNAKVEAAAKTEDGSEATAAKPDWKAVLPAECSNAAKLI